MVLAPDRIAFATAVPLPYPDQEQSLILRAGENTVLRPGRREQNEHAGATRALVAETVMHATWHEDY